jgi:hypothetical protein
MAKGGRIQEVGARRGWPRFVQLSPFSAKWDRLGLDDQDLNSLEVMLASRPEVGPVVRSTGGVRKVRFAGRDSGRGKSGAFRVYYAHIARTAVFVLVTIYAKNELSEMSEAGKRAIAVVVKEIEDLIEKGKL